MEKDKATRTPSRYIYIRIYIPIRHIYIYIHIDVVARNQAAPAKERKKKILYLLRFAHAARKERSAQHWVGKVGGKSRGGKGWGRQWAGWAPLRVRSTAALSTVVECVCIHSL